MLMIWMNAWNYIFILQRILSFVIKSLGIYLSRIFLFIFNRLLNFTLELAFIFFDLYILRLRKNGRFSVSHFLIFTFFEISLSRECKNIICIYSDLFWTCIFFYVAYRFYSNIIWFSSFLLVWTLLTQ